MPYLYEAARPTLPEMRLPVFGTLRSGLTRPMRAKYAARCGKYVRRLRRIVAQSTFLSVTSYARFRLDSAAHFPRFCSILAGICPNEKYVY